MSLFTTDSAKLRSAAAELDRIKADTLSALGRYMAMNQDLSSGPFGGVAALASLRTTEEISASGRNVTARFDQVIQAMNSGAAEYDRIESENQSHLSSVSSQA